MEELFIELQTVGVDIAGAVARFMGNKAMYLKFLKKFSADNQLEEKYDELIKNNDYNSAMEPIHTLKGLTGNLGFNIAFDLTSKILYNIRCNENLSDVPDLADKLTENLNSIREIILKYEV